MYLFEQCYEFSFTTFLLTGRCYVFIDSVAKERFIILQSFSKKSFIYSQYWSLKLHLLTAFTVFCVCVCFSSVQLCSWKLKDSWRRLLSLVFSTCRPTCKPTCRPTCRPACRPACRQWPQFLQTQPFLLTQAFPVVSNLEIQFFILLKSLY